jgi:cellulose synthase/poly-beta-1,6-N-acetylglucosamine synthase-like glycosyltransferase
MFVFIYLLINFARGMAGAFRAVQGYRAMNQHQKLPWSDMLKELSMGTVSQNAKRPKWHTNVVQRSQTQPILMPPEQIIHAVIIATYKEAREVLEPTIQSVLRSDFNMKQVIFVLAYEERAGESTERLAHQLVDEYKSKFLHAMAVKHPHNIPGEVIGKGGNVTFAARRLQEYLEANHIDPLRVMVTTLDADNRPDKNYLNALSYVYLVAPDPIHKSYQPVSLYTNNIWDAPAPSRVLATGNSFFNLVVSLRQHALRNFSSHAQPMAALIKTDYWSVRTIVEDGHQFWRSYFRFDGKYRVLPLHLPIYQDAVLAETYVKTLKAQFVQLRRWTYGASDIAYVVDKGFFKPNKVPKPDLLAKTWRLLEGHVTWAVGPILVLFGGFIPSLFHPKSYTANELPIIVSRVQTVALVIALVTVFLALKTLPPKPARYKRHRSLFMVLQWVYLPLTSLVYNSFAAFYSQTRLLLGKYMSKFDVTEKAVVTQNADGSKGKTKV